MIPLSSRICITALCAHVPGTDGEFPTCLGEQCAHFEMCHAQIVDAIFHTNELLNKSLPRRKRKKWGDQG